MEILVNELVTKSVLIDSSFKIMDVDDSITVGGTSSEQSTGYILQILFNGKNFGLWNFKHTTGYCRGKKRLN